MSVICFGLGYSFGTDTFDTATMLSQICAILTNVNA